MHTWNSATVGKPFPLTQMSAVFHIRQANREDVVWVFLNGFVFISWNFWGQDIILQLIIDLVCTYVSTIDLIKGNLFQATYEKEPESVKATPELVCQFKCDPPSSPEFSVASQKSVRNHLRSCIARIHRDRWSCWWTNWLGPIFLQLFNVDRQTRIIRK